MGYGKELCLHPDKHSSKNLWTRTPHGYQESFLHCLPKPSASKCFSVRKVYFVLLVSGKMRKCERWVTSHRERKRSESNHSTLSAPVFLPQHLMKFPAALAPNKSCISSLVLIIIRDIYSSCPRCVYMSNLSNQLVILVSTFILNLHVWLQGFKTEAPSHRIQVTKYLLMIWSNLADVCGESSGRNPGIALSQGCSLQVWYPNHHNTLFDCWDGAESSKTILTAGHIEPRHRITQKQNTEPELWARREDRTVLMNSD